MGGYVTGWLAAFADWILGIKISMSDSKGEATWSNASEIDAVQVFICSSSGESTDCDIILVHENSYVLRDVRSAFDHCLVGSVVASCRVDLVSALRSTFLSDFQHLLESEPHALGTLLGCAACIYKGITAAEKTIPIRDHRACFTCCDQTFGSGFIHSLLAWFPELASLRGHMEIAIAVSLK
jgi:hypothetical protein